MGVAGWRFAHGKRNLGGRAGGHCRCAQGLAAGSMIILGIMLYSDWPQQAQKAACGRRSIPRSIRRICLRWWSLDHGRPHAAVASRPARQAAGMGVLIRNNNIGKARPMVTQLRGSRHLF
jgi:hypothetical protein